MGDSSVNLVPGKQQPMTKMVKIRETLAYFLTRPIVRLLARTAITPNTLTWIGFVLTVGAGALIITGHLFAAGFVVLIAGFFDIMDGALARYTDQVTRFGGVFDSIIDRLGEAILLVSLLVL